MVGNADPGLQPDVRGRAEDGGPAQAQMDMFNYFKSLATERRTQPRRRSRQRPSARRARRREVRRARLPHLLHAAGDRGQRDDAQPHHRRRCCCSSTTRTSAARSQADPSLMPTAVEEMLRLTTSVMHFERTATQDTEIRGQADRRRREGLHVVRRGEPRRERLRRRGALRRRTPAEPAPRVRRRRTALLPRRVARATGDPRAVRGAARALSATSSRSARPSVCARTSSAGSSRCR